MWFFERRTVEEDIKTCPNEKNYDANGNIRRVQTWVTVPRSEYLLNEE